MEAKSASEILFPEVRIGKYVVRPWSWGDIMDLTPVFQRVIKSFGEAGITYDNIETRIPDMIPALMPFTPEILSVTLKITTEEVRAMDASVASIALLTVFNQNIEYLKNSFGQVTARTATATKAT